MTRALGSVHAGWNPWTDLRQIFSYHFMVNALLAGTLSAVLGGVVGWFMVLRRQAFAGHTLSVVSFPGAAGATWLGVSTLWGYFGFCITAAFLVAAASGAGRQSRFARESAVVGVVQAFALACGFLFISLFGGLLDQTQSLLFGTFLGVSNDQVLVLMLVTLAVLALFLIGGRQLLFVSVDPVVATSQGVADRPANVLFLLTLGLTVAEVSQVTGALLVFALLVMPASAAQHLTFRPGSGIALSVALALIVVWVGLSVSFFSTYPTGFWITTVGLIVYVTSSAATQLRRPHRPVPASAAA